LAHRVYRSVFDWGGKRRLILSVFQLDEGGKMNSIVFATSGGGGPSQFPLLFVILATFAIFYFILIRPQQRKQKQLKNMIGALKKGDRVMTSGGIFGNVVGIKENIVVLKIDENTKIEIVKSAVSSVITKNE